MEEKITFYNSKNDKLSASLIVVDRAKLTVILCHGLITSKEGTSKEIAKILENNRINSFRFDFYAHGESEGDFENITVSEGVDDIIKAYEYLKENGFTNIGLLGSSFGGACSIIAATKIPDLKLLALRSPVADYLIKELMTKSKDELHEWKEKGYRTYKNASGEERKLNYTFIEDTRVNRGLSVADKIEAETLIIHGDKDEDVPLILSEMLAKVIPNCILEVIKGADHRYSDPDLHHQAITKLVEFISQYNNI